MTKALIGCLLALVMALPIAGQEAKSQEEVDALMAIQNAQGPDERLKAAQNLLTNFKDTEFKEFAFYMSMLSYQQKNDFENMLVFGERTLELNPDNLGTLLALSFAIPLRTREFDLDKDEKLSKAEGYAKRALRVIPTMESPNPNITPDEWLLQKKNFMAQAHESLGTVALLRDDYAEAEKSLRQALDVAAEQDAATFFKLGRALKEQRKYDEAIAALDQSIQRGGQKMPNGRDAAVLLKAEVVNLKEGGEKPGGKTEESTSPQVQINQQP